jgi:hypothetical protein
MTPPQPPTTGPGDRIVDLLKRAVNPTAVVVRPGALSDPQAFADQHQVQVREWAGCTGRIAYVRCEGARPMGDLIATPRTLK